MARVGCHLVARLAQAGAEASVSTRPFPLLAIRAAANRLYWLHGVSFAVARIGPADDLERESASIPLQCAVGGVRDVAVSGETLLVLTEAGLFALSPADPAPRQLATETLGWSMAADARSAVWTTGTAGSGQGEVKRVDLSTGVLAVVAAGESNPVAVAVDEDGVYWASSDPVSGGAVRMLPAGTTTPVTIMNGESAPRALATDGSSIYWISVAGDGWQLRSRSKRRGPVRELVHRSHSAGHTFGMDRLVINGRAAYFVVEGRLERAPSAGGPAVALARVPPPGRLVSFDVDRSGAYIAAELPGNEPLTARRPEHPV